MVKGLLYAWIALVLVCIGLTAKAVRAEPIVTESTSKAETTVHSPPPSAISPAITTINSKMCSSGVSGAVQTQILGMSFGSTVRDENCELILKAETLFNMQMKTAAIAVMCQDPAVWWGMWDAGTPCPVQGKVGNEAKEYWQMYPTMTPDRPVKK